MLICSHVAMSDTWMLASLREAAHQRLTQRLGEGETAKKENQTKSLKFESAKHDNLIFLQLFETSNS